MPHQKTRDPESALPVASEGSSPTDCSQGTQPANTNARDGIASIAAALSFVVGFALYSTVLGDLAKDDIVLLEELQVVEDNAKVYYLSNFVLYILFGIAQLILALGLGSSSKIHFPATGKVAETLGIIWSTLVIAAGMIGNVGATEALDLLSKGDETEATMLWKVIRTIHSGLGGGNEIVGGLWVLLAGWLYFLGRVPGHNRTWLDWIQFGVANIAGWAGVLSTVPILAESCAVVFGVGMILWYALMGIMLVSRNAEAHSPHA